MIGLGLSVGRRRLRGAVGGPSPDPHISARYWRIFMPVPNPGTPAQYLALGRVWMYRKGSQLPYDGVTTAESSMYNGRSAALAFKVSPSSDPSNPADAWTSAVANPVNQWISVDFGGPRAVDSVAVVPMTYQNGLRNPQTLDFQYSIDGQSWMTAFSIRGLDWSDGVTKRFVVRV